MNAQLTDTPYDMKLVRVADLVGKPVAGKLADVRSRNADGSLMHQSVYDHDYPDGNYPLVHMTKIVWEHREGKAWLMWRWDGRPHSQPVACGYSGISEDGNWQDYYILIERKEIKTDVVQTKTKAG